MPYKVKLDVFEGPLDLLLYLIKKSELDIHDIPINLITEQYLEYLNLMQLLDLDLAGEFLVMATTLMHIKSRMLLPPEEQTPEEEPEEDPREELVRRLLEYKCFKEAATTFQRLEEERTAFFTRSPLVPEIDADDSPFYEASLFDLIAAFSRVLKELPRDLFHEIVRDEFTVAEKVHELFHLLLRRQKIFFSEIFKRSVNRFEAITTFLALLELIRLKEVIIRQTGLFGDIEIRRNVDHMAPRVRDEALPRDEASHRPETPRPGIREGEGLD